MFDIVLGLSSSDSVLAFLVVYGREIDLIGQMIYKFFGEPGVLLARSPASGVIEGDLFGNIRLPKVLFEESVFLFVLLDLCLGSSPFDSNFEEICSDALAH